MSNKKLSERLSQSWIGPAEDEISYAELTTGVHDLEAENERLRGELDRACKDATRYCGYHHKAEQERDALRAENEELKTKQGYLFREQSGHIEECKALRAENEALKNSDVGVATFMYAQCVRERDAALHKLMKIRECVGMAPP